MNAQSTPVRRKHLKSEAKDSFTDLTPIKKSRVLIKEEFVWTNNCVKSEKDSVLSSQSTTRGSNGVEEISTNVNFPGIKFESSNVNSLEDPGCYSAQGNIAGSEFCSQIKDLLSESFGSDKGCVPNNFQLSQGVLDALENDFIDSNIIDNSLKNHGFSKVWKYQHLGVPGEKTERKDESLSASDVMKWSDQSFLQKTDASLQSYEKNLSSQIQRKLVENVNNQEVIKSQETGWTQLNSSFVMKAIENENSSFHDLGPFYGLPTKVQQLYEEHKGIKELYSWQQECLNLEAVKSRKNLIYALPTSGGKTLVAELLILRELLCYNKNVLFILPYVSLVQEKIRDFSLFALELGFLVEEYAAGKGVIPPVKRRRRNSLLIATIEKALIIVHSLIEGRRLHEFGMIVVDELHMLSEEGRGSILESLLTQILYIRDKIQIIGMTATIGNLSEVAKFLRAESYNANFRPVELQEYIKCEKEIYSIEWNADESVKPVRTLSYVSKEVDPDGIGVLVQEVIPNDSVLIFCPSRKNCENVALLLCKILSRDLLKHKECEKQSLFRALASESNNQVCVVLKKTLPYGIAYHHSGLTAGERKLLEESFRDGTLSVICCTSTLAVGVNLPAKRVILRSPYIGKDFITLSKYKQMVGRAGRSGFGSKGESFLICQPVDLEKVRKLLSSKMDETTSKIDLESCKDLVLSAIGLETAMTRKTLRELLACSLLHVQESKLRANTKKMADSCISDLYKQGALKIKSEDFHDTTGNSKSELDLNMTQKKSLRITNDSKLMISRLGRAAMKGGLTLEKAHELYSDLKKAQSSLVLLTNLHLLYLVVPPDILNQIKPNFAIYFNACMQLSSNEQHTAKIIGVTEFAMSKLAMGIQPKNVPEIIVHRFYVSLILNELWKQQTVWNVSEVFQISRGTVQTLMMSASTFANCVLRFCEELEEFWSFKSLLSDFAPRLAHCCAAELLPLMDLPAVKRGRAKQLYEAGFKSLQILASAQTKDLVSRVDHLSSKVASQIIAAAKLLLMEKAENLREEAENVLEGLAAKSAPEDT